ncbi:MAG: hypothetical protein GQE15_34805 [Archangiaceae bacterium]|nr:hypothetical protein [Archangiaceae bacterium]
MRLPFALILLLAACARVPEGVVFRCDADGGCGQDLVCTELQDGRWCLPAKSDAGVVLDAGRDDAGARDAGPDAGLGADAGAVDAGADGGGTEDAGFDGGLSDAGADDAGAVDAGLVVDAGFPICATECAGSTCGAVVNGCLCGCSVGRTCNANLCELPRLCEGGWCYEHPLPQGGHLLSAWASSQRPLARGTLAAAWGGERGIIFEWDGYETVIKHLPSRQGAVVGLFTSPSGLRAVTNLAEVYERSALGWQLVIPSPLAINDGGTTWHDPCPAFANTTQGVFLACVDMGGTLHVLRHAGTLWEFEPTGITAPRPITFGEFGPQLLLSCTAAGAPKQLRRMGATWVEQKPANGVSPTTAYASIAGKAYAALEYGGLGLSHGLTDGGAYSFTDEAISEGRFFAAVTIGTQQVVMLGDGLGVIHVDGGFARTPVDGRMVIVREPTALHERRWLAGAAMPEGLLTVGAFGATALFRLDTTSVPASSNFAARPTDICGVPDTELLFTTYSATSSEPTFYRPDDLIRLDDSWAFKAVGQSGAPGQWSALPDARRSDAGWRNSLDQCWVDESGGLTVASPYGFARFHDGGVKGVGISQASWTNDAGMVLPPTWRGLWTTEQRTYAVGGGALAVLNETARQASTAPFMSGTGQVAGLGTERLFAPGPNSSDLVRMLDGDGVSQSTSNQGPADHRAAIWGVPDGGTFVLLQQRSDGALVLSTRATCTGPTSACSAFNPQFTSPRQRPFDVVSHLWVSAAGRPFWLRYSDGRALFNGAYFTSRTSTLSLEWPTTPDGGVGTSTLPGWVFDARSDTLPYDLWGTPTRLLVKTNRGIISRSLPP